jgi:hypothetical protein
VNEDLEKTSLLVLEDFKKAWPCPGPQVKIKAKANTTWIPLEKNKKAVSTNKLRKLQSTQPITIHRNQFFVHTTSQ